MRKERICIVKPSLEELKAGAKLDEQIDQAIRVYDKLVLRLSKVLPLLMVDNSVPSLPGA
jgi:hypothetical protein